MLRLKQIFATLQCCKSVALNYERRQQLRRLLSALPLSTKSWPAPQLLWGWATFRFLYDTHLLLNLDIYSLWLRSSWLENNTSTIVMRLLGGPLQPALLNRPIVCYGLPKHALHLCLSASEYSLFFANLHFISSFIYSFLIFASTLNVPRHVTVTATASQPSHHSNISYVNLEHAMPSAQSCPSVRRRLAF